MFQCYYSDCGKTYNTRFNLRRHINSTHLKIKNFICEICSKHFVSKQNLKEHNFIHTGEKPFPCDEPGCCKRFRQVSQLSIHKRIHYRDRIGNKKCEEILCLNPFNLFFFEFPSETAEINLERRLSLPKLQNNKINSETKLPVLPCLLSIKEKISNKFK